MNPNMSPENIHTISGFIRDHSNPLVKLYVEQTLKGEKPPRLDAAMRRMVSAGCERYQHKWQALKALKDALPITEHTKPSVTLLLPLFKRAPNEEAVSFYHSVYVDGDSQHVVAKKLGLRQPNASRLCHRFDTLHAQAIDAIASVFLGK
jgi:hypothetical protein